jgi:alanine-glyoxylate transaminase/serine-glyoxylate transaminase/serine-pyruvate transaminase
MSSQAYQAGTHFLQIPGPSNVPERVLRAMARPVIDHRGPEFPALTFDLLDAIKPVFNTRSPVFIYPTSGTGGWECALLNTLNPGDRVLAYETGHFSTLWKGVADRLGLDVIWLQGDWRHGIDAQRIEAALREDKEQQIKAVMAVHTETSTGITSRIDKVRQAIDDASHPALLLVDAVSSIACTEYFHDEWQVDVTISASQKGLMLPPGLSFNAVSEKALKQAELSKSYQSYWRWDAMHEFNKKGYFPYTPSTNLLYALQEALKLLHLEGLENVFSRHRRLAAATRAALTAWGLQNVCMNDDEFCNSTTAVLLPEGYDADELRELILEKFNMSLGTGLGKLKGKIFRIGHIGDFNELMLAGTLGGVEMGLQLSDIPYKTGGINAALQYLADQKK